MFLNSLQAIYIECLLFKLPKFHLFTPFSDSWEAIRQTQNFPENCFSQNLQNNWQSSNLGKSRSLQHLLNYPIPRLLGIPCLDTAGWPPHVIIVHRAQGIPPITSQEGLCRLWAQLEEYVPMRLSVQINLKKSIKQGKPLQFCQTKPYSDTTMRTAPCIHDAKKTF